MRERSRGVVDKEEIQEVKPAIVLQQRNGRVMD
jgi:hypothetical protein